MPVRLVFVVLLWAVAIGACVRAGFDAGARDGAARDQAVNPTDGTRDAERDKTPVDLEPDALQPLTLSVAWSKKLGGASYDRGSRVAVDKSGNCTVVGSFSKTADFGGGVRTSKGSTDVFVASYDPSGVHRWSKAFGGSYSDYSTGVAVDAAGNIYIHGDGGGNVSFGGPALNPIPFVASYTPGGVHRWSVGGGGAIVTGYYGSLALDANNHSYFTGYFSGTIQLGSSSLTAKGKSDIFLASVSASGAYRWAKGMGGPEDNEGSGVAVDASGNVYISGGTSGSTDFGGGAVTAKGWGDPFVASYTSSGSHRWSKIFGCPDSGRSWSMAVDGSGNVYVLGDFSGTGDFGSTLTAQDKTDVFVTSYTSEGVHRWSKRFGGLGWDEGTDIAVAPNGNVYLTGSFSSSIDFGGGALKATGSSSDVFVAVLSPGGAHLWSESYGTSARGAGVAVDASGGVYVTGSFGGSLVLGTVTHTQSGTGDDAFLLKLAP